MNKENIKEDIINDIDRLLNSSNHEMHEIQGINQEGMMVNMNNNQDAQMQAQMQAQAQAQMQAQMQAQAQAQMQAQAQAQMQAQAQAQMQAQVHAQMQAQAQAQMQAQAQAQMQAQMHAHAQSQQIPSHVLKQLIMQQDSPMRENGIVEHLNSSNESYVDIIKDIIYANRELLVLLLLFCFLLTPQVNSVLNTIPYTVDTSTFSRENVEYPGYLGILLRGVLFVSIIITVKKLNLI